MLEMLMMDSGKSQSDSEESKLLAGTMQHGWFGEVSASEFISGNDLATMVGLGGNSQHSLAGWLKFALNGKVLYVAKRCFRSWIVWDDLHSAGIVTGGKTVVISGKTYKVRLLKGRGDGLNTDPGYGYDVPSTHGSEWNRLIYHVSASPDRGLVTSEGISVGDWAQYSDADLLVGTSSMEGNASWCQETAVGRAINRGFYNASFLATGLTYYREQFGGWRPCLELVS